MAEDQSTQQPVQKPEDLDPRVIEARIRQAEAEARSAEAKANQDAATARFQQYAAIVPDLSKVPASTTEMKGDGPTIGRSLLTFGALDRAARSIVERFKPHLKIKRTILVTSDENLIAADLHYEEICLGLTTLRDAARQMLGEPAEVGSGSTQPPDTNLTISQNESEVKTEALPPMAIAGIAAAALPQILSLLTVKRSVRTSEVTVPDLAAAAAVAGRLEDYGGENLRIVHDTFRLVGSTQINEHLEELAGKRLKLTAKKAQLSKHKHQKNAELAEATASAADLEKALEKADPKSEDYKTLREELKTTRQRVATLTPEALGLNDEVAAIDSLLESIDTFNSAIRSEPTADGRSPLAAAAVVADLREVDTDWASLVLLVKAQPGQSAELISDRSLWQDDHFSTFVEVNVTYMLVDATDSKVVTAGTESAVIAAHGEFGKELVLRPSTTREI